MTIREIRTFVANQKLKVKAKRLCEEQLKRSVRDAQCSELGGREFSELVMRIAKEKSTYDFDGLIKLAERISECYGLTHYELMVVSCSIGRGVIVGFSYKDITPFIYFKSCKSGFQAQLFNFDLHTANLKETLTISYRLIV